MERYAVQKSQYLSFSLEEPSTYFDCSLRTDTNIHTGTGRIIIRFISSTIPSLQLIIKLCIQCLSGHLLFRIDIPHESILECLDLCNSLHQNLLVLCQITLYVTDHVVLPLLQ